MSTNIAGGDLINPAIIAARDQTLRSIMASLEGTVNKPDMVWTLIQVCIGEGINTRSGIVGTLGSLGFNKQHVAMTINGGAGDDPTRHHWRLNDDATYSCFTS